jgi:hypothetical protein
MPALQKHLVEIGNLPAEAIGAHDSFPLPMERVAAAVNAVTNNYAQLEVIFAQFDAARPLLHTALANCNDDHARLAYASILGIMGDAAGADTLLTAVVAANTWDAGWNFKAMGQFGFSISPFDATLIALARTRDPRALEAILAKSALLNATSEFSHMRAAALACETLAAPAAAPVLARLLKLPGVMGHATGNITEAMAHTPGKGSQDKIREAELRELILARALYRCGDSDGLGENILRQYAQDLHGHYARHAQAILAAQASPAH